MYKFYFKGLNNATEFYVKIIEKALVANGEQVEWIDDNSKISPEDNVLTIETLSAFRAFIKHPKRVINWYQGIIPEELKFFYGNSLYVKAKKLMYRFLESFALNHCDLNIFVSETMRKHYGKQYGYSGDNYYIMPCFNETLQEKAFTDEKYKKPTFVYTGSVAGWQCVPQTLQLFKQIKERIPEAELTIYSGDKATVQKLLDEYGVEAEIRYVPYQQLSEEIKNFKYGFLIREDNPVNNVATPTKMNSYLANGIIPIFTDVIGDFRAELGGLNYTVSLDQENNGIEKLYELEKQQIKGESVLNEFKTVFEKYYSEEHHIKELSRILRNKR